MLSLEAGFLVVGKLIVGKLIAGKLIAGKLIAGKLIAVRLIASNQGRLAVSCLSLLALIRTFVACILIIGRDNISCLFGCIFGCIFIGSS